MPDKLLHEDIPLDRAWRAGRRIYVRCAAASVLNQQLRAIGARWDPEVRALWTGSGKADAVIPLVQAAVAAIAAVAEVRTQAAAAGRYVAIPYSLEGVRARAKDLGGVWDRDRKQWAMPTAAGYEEIRAAVGAHEAALAQARADDAAQRRAERAQQVDQARRAAEVAEEAGRATAARTAADLVAAAGRVATGEVDRLLIVSTRRMNRVAALELAYPLGAVIGLGDGRRGVVTARTVWFTGDDMASSTCWHPETHDEAHWDLLHQVAVVEPTGAEVARDAREAALAAEERELDAVFALLGHAEVTEGGRREQWAPVSGATILSSVSPVSVTRGPQVAVSADGARVLWQHPGYYDDYRRSERASDDPDVLARVRALLTAGARTCGRYTITDPITDSSTGGVGTEEEPR